MMLTLGLGGGDRTAAIASRGVTEATRERPGLSWSRNSGSRGKALYSHPVLHHRCAGFPQPSPRWHSQGCECRPGQKWFSWPQTPRKKLRNSADDVFLIVRQFGRCSWLSKIFRPIFFLSKLYSLRQLGSIQGSRKQLTQLMSSWWRLSSSSAGV